MNIYRYGYRCRYMYIYVPMSACACINSYLFAVSVSSPPVCKKPLLQCHTHMCMHQHISAMPTGSFICPGVKTFGVSIFCVLGVFITPMRDMQKRWVHNVSVS